MEKPLERGPPDEAAEVQDLLWRLGFEAEAAGDEHRASLFFGLAVQMTVLSAQVEYLCSPKALQEERELRERIFARNHGGPL